MRRRIRAGGLLAVAALLAGVIAVAGAAASSEESEPPATASKKAEQADPLKLTKNERAGLRRKLDKMRTIQRLEPRALAQSPETFGGLWLNEQGKVVVAFTGDAAAQVTALRKSFAKDNRLSSKKVKSVAVDDSISSLRALLEKMAADRGSFFAAIAPYDLSIDPQGNTVVATFDPARTDREIMTRQRVFAIRYGERANDIVLTRGPLAVPAATCTREDCPELRAGVRSVGTTGCTTGFVVRGVTGQATFTGDGILSAAHCGEPDLDDGTTRSNGGSQYGIVEREVYSGAVDAEVHTVDQPGFSTTTLTFAELVHFKSTAARQRPVVAVSTYDGLLIGSEVCKSGVTTGVSCGTVTRKDESPNYLANAYGIIKADMCNEQGDSGGPVYQPFSYTPATAKKPVRVAMAVGILSGGGKSTPCPDPNDYSLFSHIQRVNEALGTKVETPVGGL